MKTSKGSLRRSGRQCVMAMVLGTALAALGTSKADARTLEVPGQAIQDITRYCSVCWRNARLPVDRWGDCTQEVFRRLLERVPAQGWRQMLTRETEERREFLRAIDAVKKQTQRERRLGGLVEEATADNRSTEDQCRQEEREVLHQAADSLLSSRQQRILQLTCEGWSIAEIAEELQAPCERISDEKYKAIQKLRQHFQAHPEWMS
jgi:RNA polymerase sigma factor (sigma-70 family)